MVRGPAASLRHKLLAIALLPLLVVLPALSLLLLWWGDAAIDRLLITKVQADLAVANGYFERLKAEVGSGTGTVAESQALARVWAARGQGAEAGMQPVLEHYRRRLGLDFLNWRDPQGRLLATDSRTVPQDAWGLSDGWTGGTPGSPPAAGTARAQVVVMDGDEFARLAPELRGQVTVPVRSTQGARQSARPTEDRAMVVVATAAVVDEEGRVRGHVQGGVLLNRNLDFIDRINDIVYPEGSLPFGSHGTATLFLEDVRISTNVRLFKDAPSGGEPASGASGESNDGNRAIGTRVSAAVHAAVLEQGRTWLDRAFVVNDWYVSAYQPLADAQGRRVGMLYVGFLERPFTALKRITLGLIGLIFLVVMAAAAWLSLRWARQIFHPIERMEQTMRRVEAGDRHARVGELTGGDEIARLARDLDHLLSAIAQQTEALEKWNAELDAKVAARTADLAQAQQQLLRSEKLAAIGQLSAGVAHEINNPVAVIQGNLDLVRSSLGAAAEPVRTELALIDQQTQRIRLIVNQVLQFARPNDYAGYVEPVDVARAVEDSLVLTDPHLRQRGIVTVRRFEGRHLAGINRQELQQVLVNLLINAAHAMPGGGTLTLSTRDWTADDGEPGVAIAVADEGPGLPEALLGDLFQPFSTGKKDGTGLGLWISRSLVERYGGDIRAANRPPEEGTGAVFTVLLRSGALR